MGFTFGPQKLELSFPDEWKDETIYSFKGPEDSGVQHGLLLTVDEAPETDDVQAYAERRLAVLEATLTNLEFLKQAERRHPSQCPAYEVVYKWVPAEGKVVFQKQVWLMADGTAFNFTATFSKKTIQTVGIEVDAIIDSFRTAAQAGATTAGGKSRFALKPSAIKIKKLPGFRKPAPKQPAAKKPPAKKPAVKKPTAKKPAVKKPTTKKPAVKKPR